MYQPSHPTVDGTKETENEAKSSLATDDEAFGIYVKPENLELPEGIDVVGCLLDVVLFPLLLQSVFMKLCTSEQNAAVCIPSL